jgi:CRISPR-associated protein Csx17
MSVHVHALRGCAPTPLAHYLKALGVLRLVATQRDAAARGFWRDEVFHLVTRLSEEELVRFFCDEYRPTPLVSPWNGGSGFYPKDSKEGIEPIAVSPSLRLAAYRAAILRGREQVGCREQSPKKEEKNAMLAACARSWSGEALQWFSAAVSLDGDAEGRYPPLLGTGGNDGRLDFTNNFMQRLVELVDTDTGLGRPGSESLAEQALFGHAARGLLTGKAIGQFWPGAAGGANGTAGFDADSLINPWDFVLMLEGALLERVAALRQLDGAELAQASAPFALRGVSEGYASATSADDSARGEQWMPLWRGPAALSEVEALFAEGRLQSGHRRSQRTLEAARAIAQLGVARGVESFVRFGIFERNGQANLAVPLGTFPVANRPEVRLLDELDDWLERFRRAAGGKTAPASFEGAARRLDALALEACGPLATSASWAALLMELGRAEDLLVRSPRETASARLAPLPALSAGWVDAIDDGSAEVRVALAIASQHAPRAAGKQDRLGSIRAHCLPLDLEARWPKFNASAEGLIKDPRVVWIHDSLVDNLAAVALRRTVDGRQAGHAAFPLTGDARASLGDVAAFLDGRLDDARIAALARGLMALGERPSLRRAPRDERPSALHALFRLVYLPTALGELKPSLDPEPLRLLMAGRLGDAGRAALRRLGAMGLRPKLRHVAGDAQLARRLAASLAIPASARDLLRLRDLVTKPAQSPTEPPTPSPTRSLIEPTETR